MADIAVFNYASGQQAQVVSVKGGAAVSFAVASLDDVGAVLAVEGG